MSKTVFISYARSDGTQIAETLENWLESNEVGFPAFRDRTDIKPGDEWRTVIDAKIDDCFVMLVVVTPGAIEPASYVNYEWIYALGKGKQIVSLIADASITVDKLHPRMQVLQYMPFVNPKQKDWNELKRQLIEIQAENDVPQSVINAVAGLNSHNPDERQQALESLKIIKHPTVVRELKRAIQHEYPDICARAGIAFAEATDCKDNSAIPGLKKAIELDMDARLSTMILTRINNADAAECLFSSYNTVRLYRRGDILDALCGFGDSCIVPYLRQIWQQPGEKDIRILRRLADFKDEETIQEIIKYIRSLQDHQKINEIAIFDKYGDNPKIVRPLYNLMLEHPNTGDIKHRHIMTNILNILERVGNLEVIDLLEQAVNQGFFRSNTNQIQSLVNRIKQKLNAS